LGAELRNSIKENTVWFHPNGQGGDIQDISFTFNTGSVWYKRIRDWMAAAMKRWNGLVQVAMTDLGGNLDILSTFRPGEKLLFDLYDNPKEVNRLTWEAHEAWWAFFDEFNKVLQPVNPGYSSWAPLFSTEPFYMLQCDFCYMISPSMFDEFVKPELAATCRELTHPFYHLDGPGQLPHLDSLLSIEELKGVQWVPGERQPDLLEWLDVYKKIHAAGKKMQVWGSRETVDTIIDTLGDGRGVIATLYVDISEEKKVEKWLAGYRAI
jgi:5-methyltetrahydrofolate--homocysteine methyltransferase